MGYGTGGYGVGGYGNNSIISSVLIGSIKKISKRRRKRSRMGVGL